MAQFASDTFTASDSTTLQSYDADWTQVTGTTDNIQITSNRARAAGTTSISYYRADAIPPSADYNVSADLYVASTTSNYSAGVAGRISTSANTLYLARILAGTGFQLYKRVAGTSTQLGSNASQSISAGNSYHIELRMAGNQISVYSSGVEKIAPQTDSAISAAGKPGVIVNTGGQSASGTVGIHIDNWSADAADATAFTMSGPSSGTVGVASTDFTIGFDGVPPTVTITPSDGGDGGTFTPTTLSAAGTFTYTAASAGVKTISATDNAGLTDPSNISFTASDPVIAPTGAITSIVVDGQTVTISGTTTNTPASGLGTITAVVDGVTQGPTAVTLGSGTFTITFTEIEPGTYSPTVTLTNAGGTNSATGASNFEILGVGEGGGDGSVTKLFRSAIRRLRAGIGARRR